MGHRSLLMWIKVHYNQNLFKFFKYDNNPSPNSKNVLTVSKKENIAQNH